MKFAKRVFKPVMATAALIGVGIVSLARHIIIKGQIKPFYKYIGKMNAAKTKLYRLVFSPYRISNGIRPAWSLGEIDPLADIQHCHELFASARLARAAS